MASRVSGESDVGPELEGGEDDEDVQDAEAEGDAGQGARPGLQPPGQHLRAVVPVPAHKGGIYSELTGDSDSDRESS